MSKNQISVIVSMGDDYQASDRLRAAIAEMGAALNDDHGDDTSGFAIKGYEEVTFTYQKIEWTWVVGSPLQSIVSPRDPASGQATGRRQYEPLV